VSTRTGVVRFDGPILVERRACSIGKKDDAVWVITGRNGPHDHALSDVDDRDRVVGHVGGVGEAVARHSDADRHSAYRNLVPDVQRAGVDEQDAAVVGTVDDERPAIDGSWHHSYGPEAVAHPRAPDHLQHARVDLQNAASALSFESTMVHP
jgi:hypothetical protein